MALAWALASALALALDLALALALGRFRPSGAPVDDDSAAVGVGDGAVAVSNAAAAVTSAPAATYVAAASAAVAPDAAHPVTADVFAAWRRDNGSGSVHSSGSAHVDAWRTAAGTMLLIFLSASGVDRAECCGVSSICTQTGSPSASTSGRSIQDLCGSGERVPTSLRQVTKLVLKLLVFSFASEKKTPGK